MKTEAFANLLYQRFTPECLIKDVATLLPHALPYDHEEEDNLSD